MVEGKIEGLTLEELDAQKVELLPPREEMALVNLANVGQANIATNVAIAANINAGGDYVTQNAAALAAAEQQNNAFVLQG